MVTILRKTVTMVTILRKTVTMVTIFWLQKYHGRENHYHGNYLSCLVTFFLAFIICLLIKGNLSNGKRKIVVDI